MDTVILHPEFCDYGGYQPTAHVADFDSVVAIIRHVADFLVSTLGFTRRSLSRDRGRPVYFGMQSAGERDLERLLVILSGRLKIWAQVQRDVSTNSVSAITFFIFVLLYLSVSSIAVPSLDSFESIERLFWTSLIGLMGAVALFTILLVHRNEYYSKSLTNSLILLLQFGAVLVCMYLYYNARMGTGIFAST